MVTIRLVVLCTVGACSIACEPPTVITAPQDLGFAVGDQAGEIPDLSMVAGDGPPRHATPGTYTFLLDAGAFPPTTDHPSALVYIPSFFDPTPPIGLVVYLHGWSNCVENVVRDGGGTCTAGGAVRNAYALAAQLEASRRNAILLCPEVAFEQQTGNPGNLGTAGGFRALLAEVLANIAPALGGQVSVDQMGPVVLTSHSGGYIAAAKIATIGGVPVDDVVLFDSLYGNVADFEKWAKGDLAAIGALPPLKRFATIYTSGTTATNSQTMASDAAKWFPLDAGVIVDDTTTATWSDDVYQHGLLFKHTALAHDSVPRYYFGKFLSTGRLAAK